MKDYLIRIRVDTVRKHPYTEEPNEEHEEQQLIVNTDDSAYKICKRVLSRTGYIRLQNFNDSVDIKKPGRHTSNCNCQTCVLKQELTALRKKTGAQ